MKNMTPISNERFLELLDKETLTLNDRFELDSFTFRTLAGEYNDLKDSEVREIHYLEIQNLKNLLERTLLLCGAYGQDALNEVMSLQSVRQIKGILENTWKDHKEKERLIMGTLLLFLMSDMNTRELSSPVFIGKVPQKLFKFRQQTAEDWWNEFVKFFASITFLIYMKLGADMAIAYAFANIAYYLNKSQPYKFYPKPIDKDTNETIARICKEYCTEMFGHANVLNSANVMDKKR